MIPELDGRLGGIAVRVPTPTGSLVDLTVEAERATSARSSTTGSDVAAEHGPLHGILSYTDDALVSSDIVGSRLLVDLRLGLTSVID